MMIAPVCQRAGSPISPKNSSTMPGILMTKTSSSASTQPRTVIDDCVSQLRADIMNGNLRPATLRRNDQGRVDPSFPLPGMALYLKPSAAQHAELLRLLDQQQNPASPLYHQWLQPEEYADRFGLGAQDLAAAAGWLRFSPGQGRLRSVQGDTREMLFSNQSANRGLRPCRQALVLRWTHCRVMLSRDRSKALP